MLPKLVDQNGVFKEGGVLSFELLRIFEKNDQVVSDGLARGNIKLVLNVYLEVDGLAVKLYGDQAG